MTSTPWLLNLHEGMTPAGMTAGMLIVAVQCVLKHLPKGASCPRERKYIEQPSEAFSCSTRDVPRLLAYPVPRVSKKTPDLSSMDPTQSQNGQKTHHYWIRTRMKTRAYLENCVASPAPCWRATRTSRNDLRRKD